MTRALSSLQDPDPGRDYSEFPTCTMRARLRWYRVYKNELNRSPWYFSAKEGRFNLFSPKGTLNLGKTPEIALREALGVVLVGSGSQSTIEIPETAISGKQVAQLEIPEAKVADFLNSGASSFGVVAGDISAPQADNYQKTRKWAQVLYDAGLGGILSRSRFGTGANPLCLYLFGSEGQNNCGDFDNIQSASDLLLSMPGYQIQYIPDSNSLIIEN